MPHQKDAEAGKQNERCGAEPVAEQGLRLVGEVRPTSMNDLPPGTIGRRDRAEFLRGRRRRLLVNGWQRRTVELAVHCHPKESSNDVGADRHYSATNPLEHFAQRIVRFDWLDRPWGSVKHAASTSTASVRTWYPAVHWTRDLADPFAPRSYRPRASCSTGRSTRLYRCSMGCVLVGR